MYMETAFLIVILIFSVIIHEIAHGAVAYQLGDDTAKMMGRLTLNPIVHLDLIGSVILPALLIFSGAGFVFGWAKPVPVNPSKLRDPKFGSLKVSAAGPISNLIVAIFFGLVLRFAPATIFVPGLVEVFSFIVYINILLAVFNLLPIPPLDGSHILFDLFPNRNLEIFLRQFGLFILLFVIFFAWPYLSLVVNTIFSLITGFSLF